MEMTEKELANKCRCSIPLMRKWLCRADFSHINRLYDKGKGATKLNRRYSNVNNSDIELLKKFIKIGKRFKYEDNTRYYR